MRVGNEELLPIGRFSQLTGLTAKALRHYDEVGVLRPAHVDEWTGYRCSCPMRSWTTRSRTSRS